MVIDPSRYIRELLVEQGDTITRDATGPRRLAKGTAGQILKQGANEPEWADPPGVFFMDFWSDTEDKITIAGAAADLDFPDVVVAGLPSGVTLIRVIAMLKVRAIKDTSGSENYIDEAGKELRIKKSTGSWGTDDVAAIDFDQYQWRCAANTKEGGDAIVGNNDVKSEVDSNATYNFRSEQTNRTDAISALADNLELYDVQTGIRVYFKV